MRTICFFLGIVVVLFSCKASKSAATGAEIDTLNDIVKKQNFKIESDWAYPQVTYAVQQVLNSGLVQPGSTASSVSLIGNPNFLTISGDSISSYLPYFGERQMQIAYGGGDTTIQFKGIVENYKIDQNKDHSYTISFEAKSNSETFQVFLTVYPNLKTLLRLNGNSRFPISYSGFISPVTDSDVES